MTVEAPLDGNKQRYSGFVFTMQATWMTDHCNLAKLVLSVKKCGFKSLKLGSKYFFL